MFAGVVEVARKRDKLVLRYQYQNIRVYHLFAEYEDLIRDAR